MLLDSRQLYWKQNIGLINLILEGKELIAQYSFIHIKLLYIKQNSANSFSLGILFRSHFGLYFPNLCLDVIEFKMYLNFMVQIKNYYWHSSLKNKNNKCIDMYVYLISYPANSY